MNLFKLYSSVSKSTNTRLYSLVPMNIFKLYLSVWSGHRRIYGTSGLTLTGLIYSLASHHPRIYVTYIHRWCGITDKYMGCRAAVTSLTIFVSYRWIYMFPFLSSPCHFNSFNWAVVNQTESLPPFARCLAPLLSPAYATATSLLG
jgi:hypothetical protein